MEREVKIAATLYECRDAAKKLAKFKDKDFKEMLQPYTDIIQMVMIGNNISELQAVLKISETEMYQQSETAQLYFMAAAVEMIEPSKE